MSKEKIGFYGGKFFPLHKGHLDVMIKASSMVDKLYIIMFHDERAERLLCEGNVWQRKAKIDYEEMKPRKRMAWISKALKGIDNVVIKEISKGYGNWDEEAVEVRKIIGRNPDVIFSSEPTYDSIFKSLYPGVKHIVFDREIIPISATQIRLEGVYKHWDYLPKPVQESFIKKVAIIGTESCVDGDTEFFNGCKWKKISEYQLGDKVLQFNKDYSATLVTPERYIKEKANKLYKLQNSYGTWSQVYSDDHDIVYITSKGNLSKIKFAEIMYRHFNNEFGFQGKLLNWFNYYGDNHIDEYKLRLMIAISADGSRCRQQWRIRLKKENKITRFRELILKAGLKLDERIYEDGYHNFYLPLTYGVKEFPIDFIYLTKKCKEIFLDELFHWDGCLTEKSYFTTIKNNLDIAQFIIASLGYKTSVHIDEREGRNVCYRLILSTVRYTTIGVNKITNKHRANMITEFVPQDGYKYCFTVPSGMLVLRRDNHIFITGNCGKSTLTRNLAKIYNTEYVEEYGRTICEEFNGCDGILPDEIYPTIAYGHKIKEYELTKKANKVLFIDSEAVITQYYSELYNGITQPVLDEIAKNQNYDLYLFLEPDVKWVDDGLRVHGSDEQRIANNNRLKDMFDERGIKYVSINGDYLNRFNKACELVERLLK